MYDNLTDEQLVEKSVGLKKELLVFHDERKAIADELRERDLKRKLGSMSEGEKATLKKMLGDSGNITVTPAPAVLNARGG